MRVAPATRAQWGGRVDPNGTTIDQGIPTVMVVLFIVFVVFIAVIFCSMVFVGIHRWRTARREGLDPLAGDIQLMAAAKRSQALSPASGPTETPTPTDGSAGPASNAAASTVDSRLAHLERLRADGQISPEEYAHQRTRILDEI